MNAKISAKGLNTPDAIKAQEFGPEFTKIVSKISLTVTIEGLLDTTRYINELFSRDLRRGKLDQRKANMICTLARAMDALSSAEIVDANGRPL